MQSSRHKHRATDIGDSSFLLGSDSSHRFNRKDDSKQLSDTLSDCPQPSDASGPGGRCGAGSSSGSEQPQLSDTFGNRRRLPEDIPQSADALSGKPKHCVGVKLSMELLLSFCRRIRPKPVCRNSRRRTAVLFVRPKSVVRGKKARANRAYPRSDTVLSRRTPSVRESRKTRPR
jgi:hypothetical protein